MTNIKICVAAGIFFCLTGLPSAQAYSTAIHYEVTEKIASACGIPHAKLIAWADSWIDRDAETRPEIPYNFSARAIFHFRMTPAASHPRVERGSREAAAIVNRAIELEEADPVLLGIGLHAYQDSWSHDGYESTWGHLFELTLPDDPRRDPGKAIEMAEATWEMLDRWSRAKQYRPCAVSWPEIRDRISARMLGSTSELKEQSAGYPAGVKASRALADFAYWVARIRGGGLGTL